MKVKIKTKNRSIKILYMQSELRSTSLSEKRTQSIVMSLSGSVFLGDVYKLDIGVKSIKEKHLDDKIITTQKIANQAVNTESILDGAVTEIKLEPRIRRALSSLAEDMTHIVATFDKNEDYVVDKRIYAKDFIVKNPDGTTAELSSTIINDTITSLITTWSSTKIANKLAEKSDTAHTHANYSLSSHNHNSSYSAINHAHNNYANVSHLHDDRYFTEAETTTKLNELRNNVVEATIVGSQYNVKESKAIVTSDFFATGGASVSIPENTSVIDDNATATTLKTWSSTKIESKLSEKSNTSHTHANYSLTAHNHNGAYSTINHAHSNYAPTIHSHDPLDINAFKADGITDTIAPTDLTVFKNRKSGVYMIPYSNASQSLVAFNSTGSAAGLELIWNYEMDNIRLRGITDKNRYGNTRTMVFKGDVIEANTVGNQYNVKGSKAIVTSDFFATGGASVSIPENTSVIDDNATATTLKTWSSTKIANKLAEKSDTAHTHANYSLSSHNHNSSYSALGHTHTPLETNAFKANGTIAYIPTDLTVFDDRDSGVYTIPYYGASQSLVKFKGTSSASGLELIWDYPMSTFKLRGIIDNNRYGETRTLWHSGNLTKESFVEATTVGNQYNVKGSKAIVTSDFYATGGASVTIPENRDIINDNIIAPLTTWSSTKIDNKLSEKSNTSHTHSNYSLNTHTHTKAQIGLGNVDNTADSVKTVNQAKSVYGNYTSGGVYGNRPNELGTHTVRFEMTSGSLLGGRDWWYDSILMNCYSNSDVPYKTMFSISKSSTLRAFISNANSTATTWERTAELWHTGNFTPSNYSPITHVHNWSSITEKPTTFTPSVHYHDERYYTESETDTKLATKSDKGHTHTPLETNAFKANGATASIPIDLTVFDNRDSGVYTIPYNGASQSLVKFKGTGSASGLELIWDFPMSTLQLRGIIDSNRYGATRTLWHSGNLNTSTVLTVKDVIALG